MTKNRKYTYTAQVLLCDVRSSQNVGSIFRTSDAALVSKIYLAGYTPLPKDQFGRENSAISKTALGAEKSIDWQHVKSASLLINKLKKDGFQIIAIEQSKNSVDYKKVKAQDKVLFILGNEIDGLPKNILDRCDVVAEIPMRGEKESLNVSVSFGIAVFRVLNV